ncbi:limb region 1 protein homolog isoform 7-T8 [Molossus nigricans]
MEAQDEVSAREQHFHSQVRESTICFLLFAVLYLVSYFIITRYKRKSDEQEDEDAVVNRISLFLCTFTLAVSAGAVLLLPFSIVSNEILLAFPHNYYMQWLNGSLIHGLWNLASLFSNLCLFVLMPFAFFFLESEGFAGLKKGIRARILETLVMLVLLALLTLGMVWVASALIDQDAASTESLYDLWEFYLPYLYSCISLMGCLLLLLCTPVGLSRMFTVVGQLLVKPAVSMAGPCSGRGCVAAILEDLDEQIYVITLEEEALHRRLNGLSSTVEYNVTELEQELENVKTLKTKLGVHGVRTARRRATPESAAGPQEAECLSLGRQSGGDFHTCFFSQSDPCQHVNLCQIQTLCVFRSGGRRRQRGKGTWCTPPSWSCSSRRRPSRSSWWPATSSACWLTRQPCRRERGSSGTACPSWS